MHNGSATKRVYQIMCIISIFSCLYWGFFPKRCNLFVPATNMFNKSTDEVIFFLTLRIARMPGCATIDSLEAKRKHSSWLHLIRRN